MSLLNEIQQKLKVPKSQYNKFSEFYYRNAEDIMEAVKPLLGTGTLVMSDEIVQVGDRYYIKATASLWNGLEGGESRAWSVSGWARETLERPKFDGAQLTGSASSYARKYALNGLFCIDDTKDADNHDNRESASVAPKTAPQRTETSEVENREKAKKDRILANLKRLGKSVKNKEEVAQAVFDLVGLELVPEKYDDIGEALGKLK